MKLEPADLDGVVTWTILRAARNVERKFTEVIAEYGLTSVQFGVLAQLATYDSLTRAELARATGVRPQSMASVIDGMLDKGLLRLAGTSGRGRPNPVVLTPEGHELIGNVWPRFLEASAAPRLGLTEPQAKTLNATLLRLLDL